MMYLTPPHDFKKHNDIVACFVEYEGKFLMLRRNQEKHNGGLWGLPAGKVEEEEDIGDAMCRELYEETGIVCVKEGLSFQTSVFVRHDGRDFEYHMFRLPLSEYSDPRLSSPEHSDFAWFTPFDSLQKPQVDDQVPCTKLVYGIP